jgi:hypothetical protein
MIEYDTIKLILAPLERGDLVFFKMIRPLDWVGRKSLHGVVEGERIRNKNIEFRLNSGMDKLSSEIVMLLEKEIDYNFMRYSCVKVLHGNEIVRFSTENLGTAWTIEKLSK